MAAVNKVHGSNYTAEHSAGLYPAAGASDDWVKVSIWPSGGRGGNAFKQKVDSNVFSFVTSAIQNLGEEQSLKCHHC